MVKVNQITYPKHKKLLRRIILILVIAAVCTICWNLIDNPSSLPTEEIKYDI